MLLHMITGQVPGWLMVWREVELAVKPRMVVLQTRRSVRRTSNSPPVRVNSLSSMPIVANVAQSLRTSLDGPSISGSGGLRVGGYNHNSNYISSGYQHDGGGSTTGAAAPRRRRS
ncbi:unnamed protein product, partial [Sphacelaria rigidula]